MEPSSDQLTLRDPQEAATRGHRPLSRRALGTRGLVLAGYYYKAVEKASPGDERMVFLMTEIQKGARAFLKKEYQWVSVFAML
jgi:Na+/H+-translocating membrane pyrophosphatase